MFKILGTIAVITMAIPAVIMGGFLLLIPYVLMNDPAYIVVLEDGSWIEVAREFE